MAKRKSTVVQDELITAAKKLEELNALKALAEKEEENTLSAVRKQIDDVCTSNDMFCGIILTKASLLQVIELALETKENIKIPYQLYFND